VLKNIGAAGLGNTAMQLERAALENNSEYCGQNYPPFRVSLIELTDRLNTALTKKTVDVKKNADRTFLTQTIDEAKAAAEVYDSVLALELITPYADFMYGEETDELLKKIIFSLEAFDCEGAMKSIIKLEENLKWK